MSTKQSLILRPPLKDIAPGPDQGASNGCRISYWLRWWKSTAVSTRREIKSLRQCGIGHLLLCSLRYIFSSFPPLHHFLVFPLYTLSFLAPSLPPSRPQHSFSSPLNFREALSNLQHFNFATEPQRIPSQPATLRLHHCFNIHPLSLTVIHLPILRAPNPSLPPWA